MATIVTGCILEAATPEEENYGDEIMCAGWNPQLEQAGKAQAMPCDRHIPLPAKMAATDGDAFLKQMYENQR